MKTNITDYHTLLLEKQRLKLVCAAQEKEMSENLVFLKEKLNPSLLMKEAILEIVPKEIRENKIVGFLGSFFTGKKTDSEDTNLSSLLKTSVLTLALKFIDSYLNKD